MVNHNGDNDFESIGTAIDEEDAEIKADISRADVTGPFHTPETTDSTRLLMTTGEKLDDLLMRATVPDRAFVTAVACLYPHLDSETQMGIRLIAAGLTGIHGKRAELVSETIIGEKHSAARGSSFTDKIKHLAGLE